MNDDQVYLFFARGRSSLSDVQIAADGVVEKLRSTVHAVRDRFNEFNRLCMYPYCSVQIRIENTKADLEIEIAIYDALKPFGCVNGFPDAIASVAATLYDDSFDNYFRARRHLADVSRDICANLAENLSQACLPAIVDEMSSYDGSPYESPVYTDYTDAV